MEVTKSSFNRMPRRTSVAFRADRLAPTKGRADKSSAQVDNENVVSLYYASIGNIPLLSKEEIAALAKRGTPRDRQEIARHNLRLVISIAREYTISRMPLLDLIQAGNLGLVIAANRYDYRRGVKFSSYATWWIRACILKEIANHADNIRTPANVRSLIFKFKRALGGLEQKIGHALNAEDRTETLSSVNQKKRKITAEEIEAIVSRMNTEPLESSNGAKQAIDKNPNGEERAKYSQLSEKLASVMKTVLTPSEIDILQRRFIKEETLQTIGKERGVTRERIRQLQKRALGKLEASPFAGELKELIDRY